MEYISLEDIKRAEANGISESNLKNRINVMYWDKERAITQPIKKREGSKLSKELVLKAEANGISRDILYTRIEKLKWTEERAITTPVGQTWIKPISSENKDYIEKAIMNGIKVATFWSRVLTLEWSKEDACTVPTGSKSKRHSGMKKIVLNTRQLEQEESTRRVNSFR